MREALGPREMASVTLPYPLQDFRLSAVADGEDPVAQLAPREVTSMAIALSQWTQSRPRKTSPM